MDTNAKSHLAEPATGLQPRDPHWQEVLQSLEACCVALDIQPTEQDGVAAFHNRRKTDLALAL